MPYAGWPVADGDLVSASWLDAQGFRRIWDSSVAGVTLPAATITTPTLPQGFSHLFIAYDARSNAALTLDFLAMRVNGLSSSNYYMQTLRGSAATASGAENLATTSMKCGLVTANNAVANNFATGAIWLPAYNAPAGYALVHGLSFGASSTTTGTTIVEHYASYFAVGGISTLTFLPLGGGSFVAGTKFTVYGVA